MTSSVQFSERTTLSSRGYSLLVKAKRYGRWWLLKGLKEEYTIAFYPSSTVAVGEFGNHTDL